MASTDDNDATEKAKAGEEAFQRLDVQARQAGNAIVAALKAGEAEGRRLDTSLKQVGDRLADIALQTTARSLGGLAAGGIGSLVSTGLSGLLGNVGAVAAGSAGLSAESVGQATQALSGGSATQRAVNVTMHISTPDVEGFRKAESQVSASLARAVARGDRNQ